MRRELKQVILDAKALLEASVESNSAGAIGVTRVNKCAKVIKAAEAVGFLQVNESVRASVSVGSLSPPSSYASAESTTSASLFTPAHPLVSISSPLSAESLESLENETF